MCRETEAQRGEETSKFSKLPPAWSVGAGFQPALESKFCPQCGAPAQAGSEATRALRLRRPPAQSREGRLGCEIRLVQHKQTPSKGPGLGFTAESSRVGLGFHFLTCSDGE